MSQYQNPLPLFDKRFLKSKQWPDEEFDVCERKHRGNEESRKAFRAIADRLTEKENEVYLWVKAYTFKGGITAEEIADHMKTTVNCISGRCSALKFKGKIYKSGTRLTRSGNPAAVLKAT